jgi:hypothetical protein
MKRLEQNLNRRNPAKLSNIEIIIKRNENKTIKNNIKPPKSKENINRLKIKEEKLRQEINNIGKTIRNLESNHHTNSNVYKKAIANHKAITSNWRYLHNIEMKN